jgi:hypothetical protein
VLERTFRAPRSSEEDLLAEAIEATGPDPVAEGALDAVLALVDRDADDRTGDAR